MTPQEIIQAKVIAIQSSGPGGSIETIRERFEFLVEDSIIELAKAAYDSLVLSSVQPNQVATE